MLRVEMFVGAVTDRSSRPREGRAVTGGTFVLHFLAPDTAPLCVSYRSVTTCNPNPAAGPLVTVRPFTKTTVRIVLTLTS